eukprot:TRINITY_DN24757_c0_g1_i1.p1 TRINITY_DN24757_c0_g1~~TRINITY_DN24757_c0_g1_i1.p1  ORF type:complete len:321 (-),score=41.86 TRINITY_DN24757_c0_g1_i1:8-865(-)
MSERHLLEPLARAPTPTRQARRSQPKRPSGSSPQSSAGPSGPSLRSPGSSAPPTPPGRDSGRSLDVGGSSSTLGRLAGDFDPCGYPHAAVSSGTPATSSASPSTSSAPRGGRSSGRRRPSSSTINCDTPEMSLGGASSSGLGASSAPTSVANASSTASTRASSPAGMMRPGSGASGSASGSASGGASGSASGSGVGQSLATHGASSATSHRGPAREAAGMIEAPVRWKWRPQDMEQQKCEKGVGAGHLRGRCSNLARIREIQGLPPSPASPLSASARLRALAGKS